MHARPSWFRWLGLESPTRAGSIAATGSVDSIGNETSTPRLEYIYGPQEGSATRFVPMRGGPRHWSIATSLSVGRPSDRVGSIALRYCSQNTCTVWGADNPNNRAAFPRYNFKPASRTITPVNHIALSPDEALILLDHPS